MKTTATLNLLSIVCIAVAQLAVAADAPKRLATIVDTAGIESEVTNLDFSVSGNLSHFVYYGYYDRDRFAVDSGSFQIVIPLSVLISIKTKDAKKQVFDVIYQWHGKQRTISGTLFSGEFSGESDFGNIKVTTSNLKEIVFTDPPQPFSKEVKAKLAKELAAHGATLSLADGTEVPIASLRRHDSYYSTEGYIVGGSTRYRHYTDFRFNRGATLLTVPFEKIKRIEFGEKESFTVTLNNGKSAIGTLSNEQEVGVEGFTGFNENGNFFIPLKHVKVVTFTESSPAK